jgi:hypothetical protein
MKILLNLFSFLKDWARFFVKSYWVPIFITLIYDVDLAKFLTDDHHLSDINICCMKLNNDSN